MSFRSRGPACRPALAAYCLILVAAALAVLTAATAQAAQYKMVSCASSNGIAPYATYTNTAHAGNPAGIFEMHNWCGGAGGDPPGDAAHLRIVENQAAGNAGHEAVGWMAWYTPPGVHFLTAGAYTRQPNAFNQGWRSRFWGSDAAGNGFEIITQGAGLPTSGTQRPISSVFSPHLWPFGHQVHFYAFVWELRCVRPAGCDRANYNATDLNGLVFILSDDSDSQIGFTNTGAPVLSGQWVKGNQNITWQTSDQGSGLRFERLRVDGSQRYGIDYQAIGSCNTSWSQTNGEWARAYQPCPTGGPHARNFVLDTGTLADGPRNLSICAQDFAQYQGLNGTGGESCTARTIYVDNTAPGAPTGLAINSANPQRYLDRVAATFSLPPNHGSPIVKVHYNVVDSNGNVVMPVQTVTGTNPTALADVRGPAKAGEYRLRVWLEDAVGHVGPAATAPIPRDTTPPAAPQHLSVAAPNTSRISEGADARWQNIVDAGSPIDTASYRVLDAAGSVVVPARSLSGPNISSIRELDTPRERGGGYTLQLWLTDAEGNVGAPVSAPLAYECVRSEVTGGILLTAGLGKDQAQSSLVLQGEGSALTGTLRGTGGGLASAPLCVFSSVTTDAGREFVGIALTAGDGSYRFPVEPGPSRNLSVMYRADQRQIAAQATLLSRVRPTFAVKRKVIRNKGYAQFYGQIPGPNNDKVVVVLQVKHGKGWRAFRRYRTRANGRFVMRYRFTKTGSPTKYVMRAQVRQTVGYPWEQGNSRSLALRVMP